MGKRSIKIYNHQFEKQPPSDDRGKKVAKRPILKGKQERLQQYFR